MYSNDCYKVIVGDYAKSHFIKSFEKTYKQYWDSTFSFIEQSLQNLNAISKYDTFKTIREYDEWGKYLAKYKFKIDGSKKSAKESWNRAIIYIDNNKLEVIILLVYAKNDKKWKKKQYGGKKKLKKIILKLKSIFLDYNINLKK